MAFQKAFVRNWAQDDKVRQAVIDSLKGEPWSRVSSAAKSEQSQFRQNFTAPIFSSKTGNSSLERLEWGSVITADITGTSRRVPLKYEDAAGNPQRGFIDRNNVATLEFVTPTSVKPFQTSPEEQLWGEQKTQFKTELFRTANSKDVLAWLLWGDQVQVIQRGDKRALVSARGKTGWVKNSQLSKKALLEVYFIDVGQGDGILVCDPDRKHILVDGGVPRDFQQTGRNAADFVDWKFFSEYGDTAIKLDAIVASHCDADHFGGLNDLLSTSDTNVDKLDCTDISVQTVYHAGLSYWAKTSKVKWLGPTKPWNGAGRDSEGSFVGRKSAPAKVLKHLLGEASTVEDALKANSTLKLKGTWKNLFKYAKKRGVKNFERLGVSYNEVGTPHYMGDWHDPSALQIKVLGPVTLKDGAQEVLPDFDSKSQNTNGHSALMRLDYKKVRILLTGDLNKNSMDFLARAYDGRLEELASDVAKACHHGSGDISYNFLKHIEAGATVISSGDAEGYAHPRPDVVGASARSGFENFCTVKDNWITPLVYSTEIERSISLGKVKTLNVDDLPVGRKKVSKPLFAHPINKPASNASADKKAKYAEFEAQERAETDAKYEVTYSKSVWKRASGLRDFDQSRIMERVHYGLINVRTDGHVVMCATKRETGEGWTIHVFQARNPDISAIELA